MSEKYTTLKSLSLESDSRYPFSPDKIRILRRNEDGFTVLQIRLVNNFDKVIVNAAIDIRCLPSGKVIKKVYSDLSAAKGEFFGTKVPVEAGKETVDSVDITVTEAVFEDGTVWTAEHFETETEPEESFSEENAAENIAGGEITDGEQTDVIETAAVYEAEAAPKAKPISAASAAAEKITLLERIGKNKLIAGACGAAAVVIIIIASALGGGSDGGEIVSETESSVANTSMTEITLASATETTTTTTAATTTTITTSETTETTTYEETQQSLQDISTEEKIFNFDGGSIECVEYKYYALDEYESTTEYINFSAKVKLNDYPDSENAINNALVEIGNMPSEEVLMASKAPESIGWGMMSEHNQIINVLAEGDLLFITTYNLWDGGGGVSLSVWGSSATYIFNMKTGKQLKVEQLFNDFDKVKQLAIDYADKYVKENVPYDVYSTESYYELLVDSTWYENGNWEYDGENFIVHFGWIFSITMYKVTDAVIPADVIRQYFVSDKGSYSSTTDYMAGEDGYYDIYQYGYVNIDSDTLNVRELPSTSAAKIGSLADGAEVYIYFYTDGWYYIYYDGNGLYGYVSSEFINLY